MEEDSEVLLSYTREMLSPGSLLLIFPHILIYIYYVTKRNICQQKIAPGYKIFVKLWTYSEKTLYSACR
ncbi:hypothetical protein CSA56_13395 [candidate division KSB3 bacterium]|uniref:Uncharacterized protein n=1 Tax=candidate division KSB3 bacterium TaxID=2044937 RepID=A0A2G6KDI8_9BACT|nr:MAG: hypothetical protein CSA56_13395 [candidate division KSB3 bacterium]